MLEQYFEHFKRACDALIELKVNIESDGWRKKVVPDQEAGGKGHYCGYVKDGKTEIPQYKVYPIFDRIPDIEQFSAEIKVLHTETLKQGQFDEDCADFLHGLYLKLNTLANGLKRIEGSTKAPNIENTVKMMVEPAIKLLSDDVIFQYRNKIEQRALREKSIGLPDSYTEINCAKRCVTIGTKTYSINSEKQWDFIRLLVTNQKQDKLTPRYIGATDYKNMVDGLRRKFKSDGLKRIITSDKDGYRLNPSVVLVNFGQMGIRKTKQRRAT